MLDDADRHPIGLMARVARVVPVDVLAAALGIPLVPAGSVAVIAQAYQPGSGAEEPADEAVVQLVEALGEGPDEAAATIALLVQAYDATAGLVGNAALTMLRTDTDQDPPGAADAPAGTFGAGPHQCPARDHATAICPGCRLVTSHVEYEQSTALRVPATLVVTR